MATLQEELEMLRNRTGQRAFMPQSIQPATQRALDGSGQRPPLSKERVPTGSVMDAPAGFQGAKALFPENDPIRLARRGAAYLWEGPEGAARVDRDTFNKTGYATPALQQQQQMEDIRSLYEGKSLGSVAQSAQNGATPQAAAEIDYAAMETDRTGGTPIQDPNSPTAPRGTGIFTGGAEMSRTELESRFNAPLKPGEMRIGEADQDGAFRGTQDDYRSIVEAQQRADEMAGRRQAVMNYQSQDQREGIDRIRMSAKEIGLKKEENRINQMQEGEAKTTAMQRLEQKREDMMLKNNELENTARWREREKEIDRFRENKLMTKKEAMQEKLLLNEQKKLEIEQTKAAGELAQSEERTNILKQRIEEDRAAGRERSAIAQEKALKEQRDIDRKNEMVLAGIPPEKAETELAKWNVREYELGLKNPEEMQRLQNLPREQRIEMMKAYQMYQSEGYNYDSAEAYDMMLLKYGFTPVGKKARKK